MGLRKAKVDDVPAIQRLINAYAAKGLLLPRSLGELYDNIRDFFVFEEDGSIRGVCALHVCWDNLAEVRSLAVEESWRKRGIGGELVKACLNEARLLGIKRVFLLTYIPRFFEKFGFKEVPKELLPQKIWGDCLRCVKFPNCDEVAMLVELEDGEAVEKVDLRERS